MNHDEPDDSFITCSQHLIIMMFSNSLKDASCTLRDLDSTSPLEQVRSLRVIYALAGDLIYLPFGTLICEKPCGSLNVALRVQSMMAAAHHTWHARLLAVLHPRCGEIRCETCDL